jgi:hypothetical protein
MNNRRIKISALALAVALVCMMALAGCDETTTSGGGSASLPVSGSAVLSTENGTDDTVEYALKLTYANADYVDEGDDSAPKILREGNGTVTVDSADADSLEYAVKSAIEMLKDTPSAHGGSEKAETLVTDAFEISDVNIENGVCTIELTGDELMDQYMYTEMFFVYQTADTILNSFDEINAVRFTVKDSEVAALSYMDLSEEITADDMNSLLQ